MTLEEEKELTYRTVRETLLWVKGQMDLPGIQQHPDPFEALRMWLNITEGWGIEDISKQILKSRK